MKLKINFDNEKKGKDNWGCKGELITGKTAIIEFLETLIENIKTDKNREVQQKFRK
jgi:hypothetical protein|tara:strand:- start:722 stop:889 length:168 start_codon:yes stop_codon:yes gene_type:complete